MTEIERKAKRLERGRYKMGYMKQFCSNEFKCSYEMPVVLPLSGDCQEATIPEVTEAKITTKNIQGAAFCQQLLVSHPVQASPPLRAPERDTWTLLPAEGGSRGTRTGATAPTVPLDSLTSQHQLLHWRLTACAPKPNWFSWHPSIPLNPRTKKMLREETPFPFGLSVGRKTVKFTVRSHRQVVRRGRTRLNDHLNPECITIY